MPTSANDNSSHVGLLAETQHFAHVEPFPNLMPGRDKFRSDISQLSAKEIELIRQFAKLGEGEFAVH